jgi:hypothetical protein
MIIVSIATREIILLALQEKYYEKIILCNKQNFDSAILIQFVRREAFH